MRPTLLLALLLAACAGGSSTTRKPTTEDDAGGPQLVLATEGIDFGAVSFGELYQQGISISNPGDEDLVISMLSAPAPFRVSPSNLQLRAGASSTVTVYVQPVSYEDFDVALSFQTADETLGTVTLPLRAQVIRDEDADGHDTVEAGGDDCADDDASIHPGAQETWYDDVDQDCDGASDYDQDGDGFETEVHNPDVADGGGDCQDASAEFYPGAPDVPYDNRDTNCDDANDWDADGDGYGAAAYGRGSDCDDDDADVNLAGVERLDGKDNDCDGVHDNGARVENAAYVYEADGSYDRAGYATALGDLDSDGRAELIIGAPWAGSTSPGGAGRGGVAVWRGGAPLPATGSAIDRADNWMLGGTLGDYVGDFLAVVGDTDGDGFPELAVGASQKSSNAGAVYLLQGRDAMYGELSSAQVTYTGAANNRLGRGIASDVDLDGDGNADIVMMGANASGYNTVFLDYGDTSRGTVATSALDAQLSTDGTEFAFFRNAPVGGDFDGDGLDDLIVSDGSADYGGTNTGAVWALWGSPTRYSGARDIETVATVVAAGSSSGEVGWATQPGGDWDGDGDDELWLFTSGVGLYVIPGGSDRRASFTPSSAALVTYAWDASDMDAESIRQVGDWTGDGVNEVLVFLEDTGSNTGVNWLYSSEVRSGTLDAEEHRIGDLTGSTDHTNGNAGYGIAPVPGDLDGDGDLDQLLGDPNFDTNQGQIYVIRNTLIEE